MTDKRENISDHITFKEGMASRTAVLLGIDNTPPPEIVEVMKRTAEAVFEPPRRHFGCRIAVGSFFRCDALNTALGKDPNILASKKSQHLLGEAIDENAAVFGEITNKQLFEYIRELCDFDQLIWEEGNDEEPAWVHVSYKAVGNRREVMRKYKIGNKTWYEKL
jgi:zinc D-Ala-D-Ala carboxypeptidase